MAQKFWYPWKHETNVYVEMQGIVGASLRMSIHSTAAQASVCFIPRLSKRDRHTTSDYISRSKHSLMST